MYNVAYIYKLQIKPGKVNEELKWRITFSTLDTNGLNSELGTWGIFNLYNNKKLFFAVFIKLIWLGVGFLNRTGAEIVY